MQERMTIFEGIAKGEEEQVGQWIRHGADLDGEPDEPTSKRLAAIGVDETPGPGGIELSTVPPLHLAAGLGHTGIVRRLLDAGAGSHASCWTRAPIRMPVARRSRARGRRR